jgi:hypothetical protein
VANFVLTSLDGRGWQGAPTVDITVAVKSANATVAIEGAACSSSNPQGLTIKNAAAVFQLKNGAQVLTVTIKPMEPPFADWAVVEVGKDGSTQVLAKLFADEDPADPFSLNINLLGA